MHRLTRAVIDRSPAAARRPIRLLARTADGAVADRLPGLAAELAFWVLLSLPATLVSVIAALSLVAGEGDGWQVDLVDRIVEVSSVALSGEAIERVLRPTLEQLVETTTVPVVSVAFLAALWTASRAVKVVLVTTAITYGADHPGGFGHRVLGFLLTLAGVLVGLVVAPLLVVGPNFGERLEDLPAIDVDLVATVWRIAYWPTVTVLAAVTLASLYHVGAPWNTRWRRDLPGAILATGGWLLGSAGLRLYGTWILDSGSVYGPLAGPMVGLLWIWLTAFAVLLGAEFNAQIERLWPTHGDTDGDGEDDGPGAGPLRRFAAVVTSRGSSQPPDRPSAGGS